MSFTKTNVPGYLKDKKSNTIINNNYHDLEAYKAKRAQANEFRELKEKVKTLEQQIEKMMKFITDTVR